MDWAQTSAKFAWERVPCSERGRSPLVNEWKIFRRGWTLELDVHTACLVLVQVQLEEDSNYGKEVYIFGSMWIVEFWDSETIEISMICFFFFFGGLLGV